MDTTTTPAAALAQQINVLQQRVADLEMSRISPYRITALSLAAAEAQLPVPGGANGQIVIAQGWDLPVMFIWINENHETAGNWYIVNKAMTET